MWDFHSDVDGGRLGGCCEILVPVYQNTQLLFPVYLPMGFLTKSVNSLFPCNFFYRNWTWFRNSLCAYLKGLVSFERKVGQP